ncbi:c-type cytochrome [Porticoccus sp.]
MKKLIGTVMLATLATTAGQVMAGDAAAGQTKAMACAACHGVNGISSTDIWPNLAGQKAGYLAKQMKAFRDGTRSDPVMSGMAKPLSDQDIDDLAAYYSSL